MLTALLCASLNLLPVDSAVLLVRVLDVSDARIGGDAILVTDSAPGRTRHFLIDASDRGATVLAHLRRYRVDTLAVMILSHPHQDHYGGMAQVIAALPVQRFVYAGTPRTATTYLALLQAIGAKGMAITTADSGVRTLTFITRGDTVRLRLLAPPLGCRTLAGGAEGDDVNNCSLGVKLTRGPFSMLLVGDAEQAELGSWLAAHRTLLTADVLKAGHHGSSNAMSAALLNEVRPKAILISANGRQHPFAEVLTLLATRAIPTYCTADAGTITVRIPKGAPWTITTERAGTCHARTQTAGGGPL